MVYEKCYDRDKKDDCHCKIKIEDSIVLIVCGDIDIDKLRGYLDTVIATKGKKTDSPGV